MVYFADCNKVVLPLIILKVFSVVFYYVMSGIKKKEKLMIF